MWLLKSQYSHQKLNIFKHISDHDYGPFVLVSKYGDPQTMQF